MKAIEFLTKEDLNQFKIELIEQLKELQSSQPQKKWIRSKTACQILSVSPSVLQQLRINNELPAVKLSTGTWLYPYDGIIEALEAKTIGRKRGGS